MGGPIHEKPDQGFEAKPITGGGFAVGELAVGELALGELAVVPTLNLGDGSAPKLAGGEPVDSKGLIKLSDCLDTDDLLLENLDELTARVHNYKVSEQGSMPRSRPIKEYLSHGFINLNKPANPSSHEVVSWVKKILPGLEKTGHSGTLDPKVTGCLIVCLDRATKLVKSQQGAGKEYVAVIRFHEKVPGGERAFTKVLEILCGAVFQRPPLISAVKRQLRIRTVHQVKMLEFDNERRLGMFWIACEAGTYIRTLCVHIGLIMGMGAHMQELRRVRSGIMSENKDMYTLHDVLEARTLMDKQGDESRLREIVQPLEALLVGMPRIMIKDTAISAICHGGQLMLVGIIAFSPRITPGMDVVIISCKGEAVALGVAVMTVQQMAGSVSADHDVAARLKRVLMDRSVYDKAWGLGPYAMEKKRRALLEGNTDTKAVKLHSPQVSAGNLLPPAKFVELANSTDEKPSTGSLTTPASSIVKSEVKRKRETETAEERAERKKRKAEKKAAKEKEGK